MQSEIITLKEIASTIGVPTARVKSYFEKGRYLEYVPRPIIPTARWTIYRKDFESAVARKQAELDKQYQMWDDFFELEAIVLDN